MADSPARGQRMIILAFDGTAGEFDGTNTNVVKLCATLKMNDRAKQLVYYQPGVGTFVAPSYRGAIVEWIAKTADLAVAWYLTEHILGGYEFLMNNHLPGDKICIFGFSRGAYTARALAGMLQTVGLLPRANREQVPFAFRIYKTGEDHIAQKFKKTFCKTVDIEFMGVWDTVASVGVILPQTLPFTSSNAIKTFRHAVSLDEHRIRFGVTLWDDPPKGPGIARDPPAVPITNVKEVWFSSGHEDVGGGQEKDDTYPNEANITFRWMLREIVEANPGILFDEDGLNDMKVPKDCVPRNHPLVSGGGHQREGNESPETRENTVVAGDQTDVNVGIYATTQSADLADATAPIHDQMKILPLWWLTQIPFWDWKNPKLSFSGTRKFPTEIKPYMSIHPTVLFRMQNDPGYKPRPKLPDDWKKVLVDI